jgi:hypothetical protein
MRLKLIFPIITGFAVVIFSGFSILNGTGYTNATGSPLDGMTCGDCHSGSGSSTPSITITAAPAFGAGNTYDALTTYTINLACSGPFVKYGFDLEILNSTSPVSAIDAGICGPAISNCKKVNSTGHTNYTHSAPTGTANTALFQFQWTAPDSGKALIYLACLGVNNNGTTTGDHLKIQNITLTKSTVGVRSYTKNETGLHIFPNPATEKIRLSYTVFERGEVKAVFVNMSGETVVCLINEFQNEGSHVEDVTLPKGLSKGLYMIKLSINDKQTMQKLIIL